MSALNEQELISKLFKDYNPSARPVKRMSQPLVISVHAMVRKVEMMVGLITKFDWWMALNNLTLNLE